MMYTYVYITKCCFKQFCYCMSKPTYINNIITNDKPHMTLVLLILYFYRCTPKWHSHMHALMDFLNFLPEEVSISILSQLDACDFYHMVQVSRNWNDFIENSEFLWKTLCLKQQNSQNLNMSKKVEHMTWKVWFKIIFEMST